MDDFKHGDADDVSEVVTPQTNAGPSSEEMGRGKRRRSTAYWAAAGIVVLAVIATVAIVQSRQPLSADHALERLREFMDDATSYRFESTTSEGTDTGDGDGDGADPGSSVVHRTKLTGSAMLPDQVHTFVDTGQLVFERMQIGDWGYYRSAETKDLLADQLWAKHDRTLSSNPPEGVIEDGLISLLASGISNLAPTALVDIAEYLDEAKIIDRPSGGVTLRDHVEVTPPRIPSDSDATSREKDTYRFSVPSSADIELELASDGTPRRLLVSMQKDGSESKGEYMFIDWNAPVDIDAPAPAAIERTPWIDEDALDAARQEVTALAPTSSASGMELVAIHGRFMDDAGDGAPDDRCPQITIDYGTLVEGTDRPSFVSPDGPFLSIDLVSRACADEYDDRPFVEGPFGDVPARDDGDGTWNLLYGSTVAQIITSLDDNELALVLATMAPLDVDAAVASVAEIMENTWNRYGSVFWTGQPG